MAIVEYPVLAGPDARGLACRSWTDTTVAAYPGVALTHPGPCGYILWLPKSAAISEAKSHLAVDREKILQAAQKHVDKKKFDKAIQEYQKIIQQDPNDARTLLKIGDLQARMEAYAEAIATYDRVGQFYSAQGFALKAIAVSSRSASSSRSTSRSSKIATGTSFRSSRPSTPSSA